MRKTRQERALDTVMQFIDSILQQIESADDRAWLLAMIKYECADRLAEFDAQIRTVAELDATDPLRYVDWVSRKVERQREHGA